MHPIPRSSNGAPWITDRRSGLRRKSSQRAATKNSKNCARQLIYSAVRRSSSSVDNSEICYICFIIAPQTRQLKPQLEVEVEVEMFGIGKGFGYGESEGARRSSSSSSSSPSHRGEHRTHVRTLKSKFLRCLKAFKKKTDAVARQRQRDATGASQRDNNKRSRVQVHRRVKNTRTRTGTMPRANRQQPTVKIQEPVKAMIMISRLASHGNRGRTAGDANNTYNGGRNNRSCV